jgi:hypothetical protein
LTETQAARLHGRERVRNVRRLCSNRLYTKYVRFFAKILQSSRLRSSPEKMEIEFDKEIDAILRSAAKGSSSVNLASEHLDADEISSFAENVLPANARVRAMEHLADCNRCRKILVEISAFVEDETSGEIVHVVETKNEIPWYKKLFIFPNLAYSLGALCVVFAGIIGFAVFQSKNSLTEVASVAEKPQNSKGASSDGQGAFKEIPNSNSAATVSNTATTASNTVSNTASEPNLARDSSRNSAVAANTAPILPQPKTTAPVFSQPNIASKNQPIDAPKAIGETSATPSPEAFPSRRPVENKPNTAAGASISKDGIADKAVEDRKSDSDAKLKSETANDVAATKELEEDERTRSAPAKPSVTLKSAERAKKIAKDDKSESRQVSGKTFRKIGGTWFDSAYGSQPQINILRGSADYKKLDSGLQNIGNSLGGTVIVVWKSKAYKIQ